MMIVVLLAAGGVLYGADSTKEARPDTTLLDKQKMAAIEKLPEKEWKKLVEEVRAECLHHYTYMEKHEAKRIVSSMDTLYLLGFDKEFKECVKWVEKNYDPAKAKERDVFKYIMTHLGALLSAYQMSGEKVLLEKAVDLGRVEIFLSEF